MRGKKSSMDGGAQLSAIPAEACSGVAPHLDPLLGMAADYYWEQDADHRFTVWQAAHATAASACEAWLGKRSVELCAPPLGDPDFWARHRACLDAHEPFRDVLHALPGLAPLHLSLSGTAVFDADGRFVGYRGVARDMGALVRLEQLLELDGAAGRALAEAESVTAAVTVVLERTLELTRFCSGRYWSVDERTRAARCAVHAGTAAAAGALADGEPVPGWLDADPVWIADAELDERLQAADGGWISVLLLPVVTGAALVGVLELYARECVSPEAALLRVLRGIAIQLGRLQVRSTTLERLRDSEARFASTMALAAIGISHVDDDGRFLYVNPQLCSMLGYSERELLARTVQDISHAEDGDVTAELSQQLRDGVIPSFKAEKRYVRKDGGVISVGLTVAVKRDRAGRKLYDVSIVEDISARKEAEQRVQYLASHDTLTNLPNRATFAQLLTLATETARRHGSKLAVLFIDLDRFKSVNDTLGHEAGDALLREAAARLRAAVRASDVVARLGGDEFVVLLQDVPSRAAAERAAGSILAALRLPTVIQGSECAVSASIGICLHPDGDQEDHAVLRNADMAMYLAKQSGKNGYRFYVNELKALAAERAAIETCLRAAWEERQYTLDYEAVLDAISGAVAGFAARVRWTAADIASVPADKLESVAAEAGLVVPVNLWALRSACAASAEWQRAGRKAVPVAVSVAKAQLRDPSFVTDVHDALQQSGIDARLLELDVTEDALRAEPDRAPFVLAALASLGVTIAIAEFGTGRASFADLKRHRIGKLKLHAQQAIGIATDAEKQRYVEGAVALGKALGLTIVATGVGAEADALYLRANGCAAWQGPLGPHALAAGDCAPLLAANAPLP